MKTSISEPLSIAEVRPPRAARVIGLTLCPGQKDWSCGWDRDLNSDLSAIREWGAEVVVTLVVALPEAVAQHGMCWVHLPIRDFSVPDRKFEMMWVTIGAELRGVILRGARSPSTAAPGWVEPERLPRGCSSNWVRMRGTRSMRSVLPGQVQS